MIIPNIWENKTCSKPPTSSNKKSWCFLASVTPVSHRVLWRWGAMLQGCREEFRGKADKQSKAFLEMLFYHDDHVQVLVKAASVLLNPKNCLTASSLKKDNRRTRIFRGLLSIGSLILGPQNQSFQVYVKTKSAYTHKCVLTYKSTKVSSLKSFWQDLIQAMCEPESQVTWDLVSSSHATLHLQISSHLRWLLQDAVEFGFASQDIWGVPKIGVPWGTPSSHPFLDGLFPELNHPASWG